MINLMIRVSLWSTGQEYHQVQLVRGKPIRIDPASPLSVREVGAFVIIDTNFGLTVHWDKGTRIYVKLESHHSNKVRPHHLHVQGGLYYCYYRSHYLCSVYTVILSSGLSLFHVFRCLACVVTLMPIRMMTSLLLMEDLKSDHPYLLIHGG